MPRPKKEQPNRSDGRYEVKITIGHGLDGKPIRKSFYSDISKDDARQQADTYKISTKAAEMTGLGSAVKDKTFSEWAKIWLEKYKYGSVRENTYTESYYRPVKLQLLPYFGNAYLRNILPSDIKDFFNQMQEQYSESHLKKLRLCLNAIFETAIENDICYKNPVKNIKFTSQIEKKERLVFDEEQYNIALNYCDHHRFGIFTRILLELGLRPCELCGLQFGDFDLQKRTLFVQRDAVEGKGGVYIDDVKTRESRRLLPVSTDLTDRILDLKPKDRNDFLLLSKSRNIMACSDYTKFRHDVFFADMQKVHKDIPRLTPHELRHTCGTLMYLHTKDIYAVSKFLGHANINITAKYYVHSDAELLRNNLYIS